MPGMTNTDLGNAIKWGFSIMSQGMSARYGTLNGQLYKQFTPGGNVFADQYPPKPIDAKQYAIAEALHKINSRH